MNILNKSGGPRIKVVYFLYLVADRWENIFLTQVNNFIELELTQIADFYLSVSGAESEVSRLLYLVHSRYPWLSVFNISHDNLYEFPGIKAVYEVAEDSDTLILYLHTKGIVSGQSRARELLSKYTVSNYRLHIEAMRADKSIDVSCLIPSRYGFAYFNFFWVRSSYIRNYLTRPQCTKEYMKNGRFTWEMWLGNFNDYSRKPVIRTFSPILGKCSVEDEFAALEVLKLLDLADQSNIEVNPSFFIPKISTS